MKRIASVLLALVLMMEIAIAKPLTIPEIYFSITLDDDIEVDLLQPDKAQGQAPAEGIYAIWIPDLDDNLIMWGLHYYHSILPKSMNAMPEKEIEYFASKLSKWLSSAYCEILETDLGEKIICVEAIEKNTKSSWLWYVFGNEEHLYTIGVSSERGFGPKEIKYCHSIARTIRYPK